MGCSGVAHLGEFVNLVREPRNPYDCNAIRVDNLATQQVRASGNVARIFVRAGDLCCTDGPLGRGENHRRRGGSNIPTGGCFDERPFCLLLLSYVGCCGRLASH